MNDKAVRIAMFVALAVLVVPSIVWAQQGVPNNAAEAIIEPFHVLFMDQNGVVPRVQALVRSLFWGLVLIELVVSMGLILMRPTSAGLEGFATFIVQRLLLIGLFAFFLENGHRVALAIVQSMELVGQQVTAGAAGVTPSSLWDITWDFAVKTIDQVSFLRWGSFGAALSAIVVLVLGALVTAEMVVIWAQAYVVLIAGVVVLGFGGLSMTRELAINYFRLAIAMGIKVLILNIIVAIGVSLVKQWTETAGYTSTSTLGLIGAMVLLWSLTKHVPEMALELIRGGSWTSSQLTVMPSGQAMATKPLTWVGAAVGARVSSGGRAAGNYLTGKFGSGSGGAPSSNTTGSKGASITKGSVLGPGGRRGS